MRKCFLKLISLFLLSILAFRCLNAVHLQHLDKYLGFMCQTWGANVSVWLCSSLFKHGLSFQATFVLKQESCLFGPDTIGNLVKVAGRPIGLWLSDHEVLISSGWGMSAACSSLIEVLSVRGPVLSRCRVLTSVTESRAFDKAHVMSEVRLRNRRTHVDLSVFTRFFCSVFVSLRRRSARSRTCCRLWKILAPLWESLAPRGIHRETMIWMRAL